MAPENEPYAGVEYSKATGWVAWVLLGGVVLVLLGAVQLSIGLIALIRPAILGAGRTHLLLPGLELTGLAWVHIVLGAVAVIVGVGLVRGLRWARAGAILLAGVSAIVNFAFIGVYPVLSITALALIAIVIYAVAVHGAELADAYSS